MKQGVSKRHSGATQGKVRPEDDWIAEGMKDRQVTIIAINDIDPDQQMVRSGMDDDHVIELSNSIARHGLLEPIVCRKSKDKYILVAGYHRLMAVKRLGWENIMSVVLEDCEDTPIKSLALIENIIRRDLSIQEEISAVKNLCEVEKLSVSQICDLLGRSREWVNTRIMADGLPQAIKDALFERMISLRVAMKIAEVGDEGIQNQILQQAIYQKLTYFTVCDLVSLYQSAPTIQDAVEKGFATAQQLEATKTPTRPCDSCGKQFDYSKIRLFWLCDSCVVPADAHEASGKTDSSKDELCQH